MSWYRRNVGSSLKKQKIESEWPLGDWCSIEDHSSISLIRSDLQKHVNCPLDCQREYCENDQNKVAFPVSCTTAQRTPRNQIVYNQQSQYDYRRNEENSKSRVIVVKQEIIHDCNH